MKYQQRDNEIMIKFNNGIELAFDAGDRYIRGISDVKFEGKGLRNTLECIYPQIATPDGMEIEGYEFLDVDQRGNKLVIRTKPWFRVAHRMEWSEHALHLRVNTSSWSNGPVSPEGAVLEWIIHEEEEIYDGRVYTGFSYGFRYSVPGYRIYQIEDKATWELGGEAAGNTFIMRGPSCRPITHIEKDTYYFSGWDLPGIANPHVFQHLPLYAHFQGFTFQYDKESILLTVHEKPSHVRSLFLKEEDDNKLLHFNQFCFDLTDCIATPCRKILVASRPDLDETGLLNHFLRVRETIQGNIRKYYGLKMDKTRPSAHVETWEIAKVENFGPIFRQLDEWGIKRAFIMPLWRSNETDIVPRFREDRERFGVLGNMCCPLEMEIADCYGGWDGLGRILATAVELGIDTYMWFGSHFSSSSPLGEKIKDLFARDVSGQLNRNNYGHVLFAINQNNKEYQEYLIDRFRKAKECGLRGVFRDSHFNMAADTINYTHNPEDDITSMHDTEAAIQSRFQNELGMLYYVESMGLMGTPMCGSSYEDTRGFEFVFSDVETGLDYNKVREYGDDVSEVYFRGLSARMIYQLHVEVNKFPDKQAVDPWWNPETMVPMTKGFLKVEPYMGTMYLMEDDKGILWRDGEVQVVFAYKDLEYKVDGQVLVEETTRDVTFTAEDKVNMEKMRIYLIKPLRVYEEKK